MAGNKSALNVHRKLNRIFIDGYLETSNVRFVLRQMHEIIERREFRDLEIDFTRCTRAGPGSMLAIAAQSMAYLKGGIETSITLPESQSLSRLFSNTNWAYLVDPRHHSESTYSGTQHLPALRFSTGDEQYDVVSRIMEALLGAIQGLKRQQLRAIEWCVNEITDNVINHSESTVGGIVQLTNFTKYSKVQITVCDAGVGIPNTLRYGHPEIRNDQEALDRAIREGITRDKAVGQGNGLYGSWSIARHSGGEFFINSGYAHLASTEKLQLHCAKDSIPYKGTIVSLRIDYSDPINLDNALRFGGKVHSPTDYLELKYESDGLDDIHFKVIEEARGLGTRAAGNFLRTKIENILNAYPSRKIVFDFTGVDLISSSFADEIFGKLLLKMGFVQFASRLDFRNIDPLVRGLIDRSVSQRASTQ